MSKNKNRERTIDANVSEEVANISFVSSSSTPLVGQTLVITLISSVDVTDASVRVLNNDLETVNEYVSVEGNVVDGVQYLNLIASEPTSCNIVVKKEGCETLYIPLTFHTVTELEYQITPDDGTTSSTNFIKIKLLNPMPGIRVSTDNENITVTEMEAGSVYYVTLASGTQAAGNVIFERSEPTVAYKSIPVAFREGKDDRPIVEFHPIDGSIEQSRELIIDVKNTNSSCTLTCEDSNLTITAIETKEGYINSYSVTSDVPGTYQMVLDGEGVIPTTFVVTVRNKVEIYVASTNYTFRQEDLPCKFPVYNVRSTFNVLSSNSEVIGDVIFENNQYYVNVDAVDPRFVREITGVLSIQHEEDDPIDVNVTLLPQVEKTKMSIDGMVLQVEQGRIAKFKIPSKDQNDDVEIIADKKVNIQYNGGSMVYASSDVPGEYKITVKHTEWLDSSLTLKVRERMLEAVVKDPDAPVFDLGTVPSSLQFTTVTEDLVSDVCNSTLFKDDRQRCAFLIQRGPEFIRTLGTKICKYQEVMTRANKKLTGGEAAKCNYSLYTALMSVLNIADYYEFREAFRFLVKMFKIYHEDSLKDLNLMRFDTYWRYGDSRLEEFKLISVFLNKYVELDGQNVKVNGLNLKQEIINNIIKYCGENIRP